MSEILLISSSFWSHLRLGNLNETRNPLSPDFFLKILNSIFQSFNVGVGHKSLLQLFLIGFCLFRSKIGKRQYRERFSLSLSYYLDDQHDFHTLPGNAQQIFVQSWYIFNNFIKSVFQIQNTIRLFQNIDQCQFDHYLHSPNY